MNYAASTQNNPFGTGSGSWGGRSDAYKYPNPFCDIASMYLPTQLSDAFAWSEYLLLTMPPFMAVINRVVSYFLTDIEVTDVPDDVRGKYHEVLTKELHIIQRLQDIGKDYFCFSGDTEVYTKEYGSLPIGNLAGMGEEVHVCGIDGKWHPVRFESHGIQETREVEFGTGLKVRATANHRWWVDTGSGSGLSPVETVNLKKWHGIPLVTPPRPETDHDYWEGAVHGVVFGSRHNRTRKTDSLVARLCEEFELEETDRMQEPPDASYAPSYWHGFLGGMVESCGYFHKGKGNLMLSDRDPEALETIRDGLRSIGIQAKKPSPRKIWQGEERYYMGIGRRWLEKGDFLFEDTAAKFEEMDKDPLRPRKYTFAKVGGEDTARQEEVFCCVEPETHTFVLAGGVATGNCYGNAFVSLYLPFDRFLECPDCGAQIHISKTNYDFDNGRFLYECPKCRQGKKEFKRVDRRLRDTSKINIIRWNPKYIRLKVHPISGEIRYYYKLEEKFVSKVKEGDRFYIDTTPWGFIETCLGLGAKGRNKGKSGGSGYGQQTQEYLFEFEEGQLYHMRDTVLAGLSDKIRGWAIPPILPYFKLAYYIQLMRRYDEAIALDFIMPFRVLFPQGQAPGGQDALTMVSMQTFISAMNSMVEKKRANMTSIEVAPFAIGYQMIGGEAKALAPKDSIQMADQELLNAMGFPQELFAGTLSLQAAPVALRLFEKEWNPLVDNLNSILQWVSDQVAKYFMWDKATVNLTPVTLADDMEKKGIQLQAAAGQDISKQTAYRSLGIDYLKEQERVVREQQDVQKLQQKAMAEAQAQMANGAMGGGGGGAEGDSGMNGPGGQVGATPGDVQDQAAQIAQQLVMENNPAHSRQVLAQIKQTNETLWSLVKGKMQEQRQQLSSAGRQQMIAQMQQGG